MLKKILLSCFIIMFTFNSYSADRIKVIGQQQECGDYFIASNNNKYYLLERFRGPTPNDGDVIEGDFSSRSFGFRDVFYPRTGRDGRVYVTDYFYDENSVENEYLEKCN